MITFCDFMHEADRCALNDGEDEIFLHFVA